MYEDEHLEAAYEDRYAGTGADVISGDDSFLTPQDFYADEYYDEADFDNFEVEEEE